MVQIAIRHARGANLPRPIKGKELHVLRPTGPKISMSIGTATSIARQIRDGSSAPARVGNQKNRPRPISNRLKSAKARSRGRDKTRHGSRAIKEPAVIISPTEAAAGAV